MRRNDGLLSPYLCGEGSILFSEPRRIDTLWPGRALCSWEILAHKALGAVRHFALSLHSYRLQLLAPAVPPDFPVRSVYSPAEHAANLSALQRLRGQTYLQDGAIQVWQVDEEGRHRSEIDERAWHFALIDEQEQCIGCARYLLHAPQANFADLQLRSSALARDPEWKEKFQSAVESELLRAQEDQLSFAELGGWAIAAEYRHTKAALEILLGSFVWAELLGHCLCATTATFRNQSASILRRIGGRPFLWNNEELPGYFDPQYDCEMELLRFDSRELPARFAPLLREMRAKLMCSSVLSSHPPQQAIQIAPPLSTWELAAIARFDKWQTVECQKSDTLY